MDREAWEAGYRAGRAGTSPPIPRGTAQQGEAWVRRRPLSLSLLTRKGKLE